MLNYKQKKPSDYSEGFLFLEKQNHHKTKSTL